MSKVDDTINIAAKYIREGKLVAFPTETVYGLGADALNPLAVARIFELKERPSFDPLIVHIADIRDLETLAYIDDDRIYQIIERFWPGPLTIILPKKNVVPDIVTSGLQTVGIRMPDNPIALELIRKSGCPIAAPSANKFGRISPTNAGHVKKQLPDVDYILDGGSTKVGIESTIIVLTEKGFHILRSGTVTREELEQLMPYDSHAPEQHIFAPGMLKSHYSPNRPMVIADSKNLMNIDKNRAGLLSFSGKMEEGFGKVIRVSDNEDLKAYAVNIFAAMHELEESNVDIIVAEPVPETGIGIAIMDRLRKAAYRLDSD
jgi:L-threonylcarbamoyladenylate synthase